MSELDQIAQMINLGISFNHITKDSAERIMKREYAYNKLMEYSSLFDIYTSTDKAGRFVSLDFSYFYDIACIDSEVRKIIMVMCLDVEQALKTIIISDINKYEWNSSIVSDFVATDSEFIQNAYSEDNVNVLSQNGLKVKNVGETDLNTFLEIVSFGTLQRFVKYVYDKKSSDLCESSIRAIEPFLDSIRILRNAAAHNNAVLCRISEVASEKLTLCKNNIIVRAFLGSKGIKHRNLDTNLSRTVISDMCSLIHSYCKIRPSLNAESTLEHILSFMKGRCLEHREFYDKNTRLCSVYQFMLNTVEIYLKSLDKCDAICYYK